MNSMNDRQNALMAYFATIAFDPKVRAAKGTKVLDAVVACVSEDFPAVAAEMARGGAHLLIKKITPFAESVMGGIVGDLFKKIDEAIDGVGRSAERAGERAGDAARRRRQAR